MLLAMNFRNKTSSRKCLNRDRTVSLQYMCSKSLIGILENNILGTVQLGTANSKIPEKVGQKRASSNVNYLYCLQPN